LLGSFLILSLSSGIAEGKLVTRTVPYQHEGTALVGYLAYDDAQSAPRPGVLVIPEWWGLNDYAKRRARELAQMGYAAFAADMYGNAKSTRDPKQAEEWSSAVGSKPGLMASRPKAALDILRAQPQVDATRVAAIGFCFGGSAVLQLAYSGENLQGAVIFHGGLAAPDEAQAKLIKTPLLILHGSKDTFTSRETIDRMRTALDASGADWYMVTYAHAAHAFSDPESDSFKIPGIAYNEKAARRSWDEMQRFFREQFAK